MEHTRTRYIALASIIAALYATLTLCFEPFCYGPFQCRISEVLTVLPLLTPAAIPGLTAGCLIANLLGPFGAPDILFGTLCTLTAALGTWRFRKHVLIALLCPVLVNALGVSLYLHLISHVPYWATVISILAGEAFVVYCPGYMLYLLLKKHFDRGFGDRLLR